MKVKDKKMYLIALTLLVIVDLFLVYQFIFCTIRYHIIESIVVTIPLIICIIIYWLLNKEKIKVKLAQTLFVISTICFFNIAIIGFVMVLFSEGISHEENPWKYNHIKEIAGYMSYTYQFPKELSNDYLNDRKIKFYYTPQFLQGPFQLKLLMELNENEISDYIKTYKNNTKIVMNMKECNEEDLKQYVIYEPYGIFKEDEYEKFIENAIFYIFESKPYKPDNWNHGVLQYMAENDELNQLLIVTEIW